VNFFCQGGFRSPLMKGLLLAAALWGAFSCTAPDSASSPATAPELDWRRWRILDLTHAFNEETHYWPTAEGFEFDKGPEGMTEGGYFYNANSFCTAEHGGTHLDAPYHFYEQGWKAGEIPAERFAGPGALVDVTAQCREDRSYQVRRRDFLDWEERHGRLPEGAMVLIRTGFGAYWGDAERYLGTAERGERALDDLQFPGLAPEAARWLAGERSPSAVGIDTASIDHGPSTRFESHVTLAARNVLILENAAALERLPEQGFHIVALPMKIERGSGAPLRIIALLAR